MVTSKTISNGLLRALTIMVSVALILFLLYTIRSVIFYLCISLILALITNPLVVFLEKKLKLPNTLAALIAVILIILSVIGFILLFVPLIISQANNLSLLDTDALQSQFVEIESRIENYFNIDHVDLNTLAKKTNLSSKIDFGLFTNFINTIINFLGNFGVGFASTIFITFFFIKDQEIFKKNARKILPDQNEDKILNSIEKINHLLTRYFIGLLTQLSVIFVLYYIVLLIFNCENALIIAFICALLNIIPYIGPIIGTILAVLLSVLSMLGQNGEGEVVWHALYVFIGFTVVQMIDNNISGPLIFSKSVNSHPLEIFLVILISGILFGIVGMIVAVPMLTIFKVIAKEFFPNNKFVKVLTENI